LPREGGNFFEKRESVEDFVRERRRQKAAAAGADEKFSDAGSGQSRRHRAALGGILCVPEERKDREDHSETEMKTKTTNYLEIVQAEYLSGYIIRLSFNDGLVREMDFEPFLRKAMNPQITKYRQLRNFKKFHLSYGDLMWGDFEMIFPIEDLHCGKI
jgi:hypothetical protein